MARQIIEQDRLSKTGGFKWFKQGFSNQEQDNCCYEGEATIFNKVFLKEVSAKNSSSKPRAAVAAAGGNNERDTATDAYKNGGGGGGDGPRQ